jgi:hypothetical protein
MNLKNTYWYFQSALSPKFCDELIEYGNMQKEQTAITGKFKDKGDLVENRGVDSKRMVVVPVATVQEFRHQSIKVIDKYLEQPEDKRKPMMFVLDSLGMLSTTKEMEDTAEGK